MSTSQEKIIEVLENIDNSICDDCLSEKAAVFPRQQVNAIARNLQKRRIIYRGRGICSLCGKGKITNSKLMKYSIDGFISKELEHEKNHSRTEAAKKLDEIRRNIIDVFKIIDKGSTRLGKDKYESFSTRLSRLEEDGKIDRNIASIIRMINSFRNLVVYEDYQPDSDEFQLLQKAFLIIDKWCLKFNK